MRRRFGRRRRSGGSDEGRGNGLEAGRWLERVKELGVLPLRELSPAAGEDGGGLAVLGVGEDEEGERVVVGVSPRSGGDALLGTLALAGRLAADEGFRGTAVAVAPSWSPSARQRLGLVGETSFKLWAAAAPALIDAPDVVEPETAEAPAVARPEQVIAHLARPADRELCRRAAAALQGLAAKHGGSVRGVGRSLELVLLARRAATLRADEDGVVLDTLLPQRYSERLRIDGLADVLDRLEGLLRKRLNDRGVRDGEEGLRSRVIAPLAEVVGLRGVARWPLGGADLDVVDLAAVAADGRPVLAAIRGRATLAALGPILDAALRLQPFLPNLLEASAAPVRLEAPRLVLAAEQFEEPLLRAAAQLAVELVRVEISGAAERTPELRVLGEGEAARPVALPRLPSAAASPRGEAPRREGREGREPGERFRGERGAPREGRGESRAAERSRELREPAREPRFEAPPRAEREATPAEPPAARRFEEVSLFDLAEEGSAAGEGAGAEGAGRGRRRRRRGRGRGRTRSASVGEEEGEPARQGVASDEDQALLAEFGVDEDTARGEPARVERRHGRAPAPGRRAVPEEADEDVEEEGDLAESLAPLEAEVPDFVEEPEPRYEEDEEAEEPGEGDPERERMRHERELRRRARIAKAAPDTVAAAPARPPRPRRAALLAHADRDSVAAAVLLARDLRPIEGLWIYPQTELMTFFRSVATDLREETPIYVVGFTASPARDTLQAASLYQGRLVWFDHHAWPPEDLEALRGTIGREAVHVVPGARSSLPLVLSTFTRRSRFSDKLVDLVTARFTQHDYERWGRLWWWRLGELAARHGERRADVEALLVGRPSDLSREAAGAPAPPPPAEAEFVAGRDFRIVHFGGWALVVVPTPPPLEVQLAARIARGRYGTPLSLAWSEGEEQLVLAGDEVAGRRAPDLLAMVEHLCSKHDWIEALPDADHVARFRVRELASHPERIDEVLSEIGMGRSILEG